MGRLDEALVDLEASRDRYQQIASDMVAYPLSLIGELHRERGNLVQARAAYEEAVSIAEGSGDRQALVPALAGLATVLVGDDPQRATEIARRAVGRGHRARLRGRAALRRLGGRRHRREEGGRPARRPPPPRRPARAGIVPGSPTRWRSPR